MKNEKGQFIKGFHYNEKWNLALIDFELKSAVKTTVEKFGFAPPFTFFRTHPEYRKITCAIANRKLSRSKIYKKVLDELGYNYPEKKSGYYLDGNIFRGFYEFISFCFMKACTAVMSAKTLTLQSMWICWWAWYPSSISNGYRSCIAIRTCVATHKKR